MKGESSLKMKDVVSTDSKGGVKLKFKAISRSTVMLRIAGGL